MRKRIASELGIELYDIYGLTEIYGPGIGISCAAGEGMHVWSDFVYVEIIDPVTGKTVPDGTQGEIVITTLQKEGAPLILCSEVFLLLSEEFRACSGILKEQGRKPPKGNTGTGSRIQADDAAEMKEIMGYEKTNAWYGDDSDASGRRAFRMRRERFGGFGRIRKKSSCGKRGEHRDK